MAEALCGVCHDHPKKYKCPTCSLPYCSLACFQTHKPDHDNEERVRTAPSQGPTAPVIPQPPPPAPAPRYLKQKTDFSLVATNPRFQELLKTHPTLLPALQRIYAATLEPDAEDKRQWGSRGNHRGGRGRGRGWDNRGRGRGGRFNRNLEGGGWTQKKGDGEALKMLRSIREGNTGGADQDALREFIGLVSDLLGEGTQDQEQKSNDVPMGGT